jgi:hypothetical protein
MVEFYGIELGNVREIVEQLRTFIPLPPYKPQGDIDYLGWVNTQIANHLLLDVYEDTVYINIYTFEHVRRNRFLRRFVRQEIDSFLMQLGKDKNVSIQFYDLPF